MLQTVCLICGLRGDEVEKMHYFPTKDEKPELWQETIGMNYKVGVSLRNHRICCCHFSNDPYVNLHTGKLHPNAVPTLHPHCTVSSTIEEDPELTVSLCPSQRETIPKRERILDPVTSTSGVQARTPDFWGIFGVSKVVSSPRKQFGKMSNFVFFIQTIDI